MPNVRSTMYTYGGIIRSGPLAGTVFDPDGTPREFRVGELVDRNDPNVQVGGDGVNKFADNEGVILENARRNGFTYFSYDLNDRLTAYVQGIWGRSELNTHVSQLRMTPVYGTQLTIFRDNAFLPESIQMAMDEAGVDSFPFNRQSSYADWTDIQASENTTESITTGVNADIGEWSFRTYYQYGKNRRELTAWQPRLDRVFEAVDAVVHPNTGEIVCRSTLVDPTSRCQPLNLFGEGQMSRESIAYIHTRYGPDEPKSGFTETDQHVLEATIDGDVNVFRGLWGIDEIPVAAGISYRKEGLNAEITHDVHMPTLDQINYRGFPPGLSGDPFNFQHANMLEASGEYSVREAFVETLVPLVSSAHFAESLNLSLAARYADYSGSGGIWAWKTGVDWQVNSDLRFRVTRSQDVRAANL